MLKRSRLEVYFDVLKAIGEGVDKPTRIMYKANLSWNTLEDALATLANKEFVIEKRVGNSRRYLLSPRDRMRSTTSTRPSKVSATQRT